MSFAAVSFGLQAYSAFSARSSSRRSARAARAAGEKQGQEFEKQAGQTRAIGSRRIGDESKKGRRIASRAQAVGAASGAGGYEGIIDEINEETELRMLTAFYNSETSALDLEVAASVARTEGADAARAIKTRGDTAVFGGLAKAGLSFYERFNPAGA